MPYIAAESPERAAAFVGSLEAQCEAVAHAPLAYPSREDLAPGLRMVVRGRYLVLFRALPDGTVRVERVVHGARNLRRLV